MYTRSASADAPAEAWTQRASRSPCSLRAGSPWHDGCLCLSVCQVCKEQNRNSGHGRGNHERKRSSLASRTRRRVQAAAEARMVCKRSAGQDASTAGPPESARMRRPEVLSAHLRSDLAGSGRVWQALAGCGRLCRLCGRLWQGRLWQARLWQALTGSGRLWQALAGFLPEPGSGRLAEPARLWQALAGSGRLWQALAGSGRLWQALKSPPAAGLFCF